jgi:hypothetical protein
MDERTRRVGANEALFRQVNEELQSVGPPATEDLQIVCECGDLLCTERLPIPVSAYESARRDPALFLVVPGHEIPDVEDVVENAGSYVVVRKKQGEAEQLARATDPRNS